MRDRLCFPIFEGIVSQTGQYKDSKINHNDPHAELKEFWDRAFCAYKARLWNVLPGTIEAYIIIR